MTSKERLMYALNREKPDRLPVSVHQWQGYHLDTYLNGINDVEVISSNPDNRINHHTITTPQGGLTYKTGGDRKTTWITEYLIKRDEDLELIFKAMNDPAWVHELDTPVENIAAYADAARECIYA